MKTVRRRALIEAILSPQSLASVGSVGSVDSLVSSSLAYSEPLLIVY